MIPLIMNTAFHTGECFTAYRKLGAHPHKDGGWRFALWAPNAMSVSVEGDFNDWKPFCLQKDKAGVWQGVCPLAREGQLYKYIVTGQDGSQQEHSDPYAFEAELRPGTASRLCRLDSFRFSDEAWMQTRQQNYNLPMNIYELHAGSWKQKPDGSWYNYEELADQLIPWLIKGHYTHLELLPLAEHPLDASWGYQDTGYFAPTSRYGTPKQFAALVNRCHEAHIGVLIDFVPVHFASNADGLARLDGTPLYEYDSDVGHSEWGTCNFNMYRGEVCSFLQSAAALWLDVYHCDGLRLDAVSRALYWQGDETRGVNEGNLRFLRRMNEGLHQRFPGCILMAEDSSTFCKVTAPVAYDGLGFDYKWDMGWMHDTLNYFATPFEQRPEHYHKLTFSMSYFYRELYLLAFSHDEVVHGKRTILDRLWGSYEQKFAQARLLYLYMYTHPGKKLNFMGNELGHFREWDENRPLDWDLLAYPMHSAFLEYMRCLGELYQTTPALYEGEYNPACFSWVECSDCAGGVYAYLRHGKKKSMLIVLNTSNKPQHKALYFEFPVRGKLVLSTDDEVYGGFGAFAARHITADAAAPGASAPLPLTLPPLCGLLYELS